MPKWYVLLVVSLFLVLGVLCMVGEPAMAAEEGTVVGIVGAGPAGMALAEELANAGVSVVLLEGTSYAGGNVAHGYFYTKDYREMLARYRALTYRPNVRFFGHVRVGEGEALELGDLERFPLSALVFTNGARPQRLGIPGEERAIPAPRVFYYYNGHEEVPEPPAIGRRIAVVGSGSTAIDLTKYLLMQNRGAKIFLLVRRGPGQYGHKYPKYFTSNLAGALDREAYRKELARIAPLLAAMGESADTHLQEYLGAEEYRRYAPEAGSVEVIHLVSPTRVLGEGARTDGIELERNRLVRTASGVESEGTGERFVLPVDTVITSLGGAVHEGTGLPLRNGRVRTKNGEDAAIRRDSDVPDPERYFATRTLAHYEVDFARVPPFPVYVAGWARMPGIGSTEEVARFSNVPDGRTLARLLAGHLRAGSFRDVIAGIEHRLLAKGCAFLVEAQAPPAKRPYLAR